MSEPLPPSTGPDDPFSSDPGTSTSVLEREETREQVEPGDHERFAHYVRKEKILDSALSGKPVIALCGKVWVPEDGDQNEGGKGSGGGRKWGFGRNPGSGGA
jgi:hypothetical protein